MTSSSPGESSASAAACSSSAAPLPSAIWSGRQPVAVRQQPPHRGRVAVGIAVARARAPARSPRSRSRSAAGPATRCPTGRCRAPARAPLPSPAPALAPLQVQLRLVDVVELPVVVAEAHARRWARGSARAPGSRRTRCANTTSATPTLTAKMRSSAPRSCRWPAARRDELPGVVHALRQRHRQHQRRQAAEQDRADPGGHVAGQVLHLRADPEPAERLRPNSDRHSSELDREQPVREQPVGALAPVGARLDLAVAHRRRAGTAPDEESAGVGRVVCKPTC